jgi:hypothetical protein
MVTVIVTPAKWFSFCRPFDTALDGIDGIFERPEFYGSDSAVFGNNDLPVGIDRNGSRTRIRPARTVVLNKLIESASEVLPLEWGQIDMKVGTVRLGRARRRTAKVD